MPNLTKKQIEDAALLQRLAQSVKCLFPVIGYDAPRLNC